jgi:hypothetical protein
MDARRIVGVGVVALTVAIGSAPTPALGLQQDNCAFRLVPTGAIDADGARRAQPVLLGCFATIAEALTADPLASVLIGTEYDGTGYTGASNSYFAAVTCSATVSWAVSYVGDTWNDRFASGKGFGGCDHNKKYFDANFGGTVLTCTPNCSNYGSLVNEVSSLKWLD